MVLFQGFRVASITYGATLIYLKMAHILTQVQFIPMNVPVHPAVGHALQVTSAEGSFQVWEDTLLMWGIDYEKCSGMDMWVTISDKTGKVDFATVHPHGTPYPTNIPWHPEPHQMGHGDD
jgi:hypothetical protein